jgi:RNA recognition motif-containing protein
MERLSLPAPYPFLDGSDDPTIPAPPPLQLLYDTFSAFGVIVNTPKIMRDPDTGVSKGFGFVSYDCFEASDAAIEAMNGQFLCNRAIAVSYAYKKESKGGRWRRGGWGDGACRGREVQQRLQVVSFLRGSCVCVCVGPVCVCRC